MTFRSVNIVQFVLNSNCFILRHIAEVRSCDQSAAVIFGTETPEQYIVLIRKQSSFGLRRHFDVLSFILLLHGMVTEHLYHIMEPVERYGIFAWFAHNEIMCAESNYRTGGNLDAVFLHIAVPGTKHAQNRFVSAVNGKINNFLNGIYIHNVCCWILLLMRLIQIPYPLAKRDYNVLYFTGRMHPHNHQFLQHLILRECIFPGVE